MRQSGPGTGKGTWCVGVYEIKKAQLEQIAAHRENLRHNPSLHWLFFEITQKCNLFCRHCGSRCITTGDSLSVEDIRNVLTTIEGMDKPAICLTGGEPLLHPDFFDIADCIRNAGFHWGMTSNGTLIDETTAAQLSKAGMSSISVSLDGLEQSHDELRQCKGAWKLALRGIRALQNAGFSPQVTTVLNPHNFSDAEPLYALLNELGVKSWRLINTEPIGRACEAHDLLLSSKEFAQMLSFIRAKRYDPACTMEVTFGCSHYLGVGYERMVRDHYFLCGAGILTASVRANGDICGCLDIENRPELVQGNIRKDRFADVWKNRFELLRRDRTADCVRCQNCRERMLCGGDAAHTWDWNRNEPLL